MYRPITMERKMAEQEKSYQPLPELLARVAIVASAACILVAASAYAAHWVYGIVQSVLQ